MGLALLSFMRDTRKRPATTDPRPPTRGYASVMSVVSSSAQDSEFVKFWNNTLALKFERFRDILMNGLARHGAIAMDTITARPGWHVLDVGCGWGDTAIAWAHKIGSSGRVVGFDCTESFLTKARADARAESLEHVRFVRADVEIFPFEPAYDLAFSRFGTMFFSNPVPAMRNIRRALKPGAMLQIVVWRTIRDNPWLGLAKELMLGFLPAPTDDAETCGPGPFSMADEDLVRKQLLSAGYADIEFTRVDTPVVIGSSLDEAVAFQLALGPAGEVFREAGALAEERRADIEGAMRAALSEYDTDAGVVMDSSSWTITARNP